MTPRQRDLLLAAIKNQPSNPPSPRLTIAERDELRSLMESGREDDAWGEYTYKWQVAFSKAKADAHDKSAKVADRHRKVCERETRITPAFEKVIPSSRSQNGRTTPTSQCNEHTTSKPINRMKKRVAAIVETAKQLGYDPMLVPIGGKSMIRRECLKRFKGEPHRFTSDTFKKSWQGARDAGMIDVENVDTYRGR